MKNFFKRLAVTAALATSLIVPSVTEKAEASTWIDHGWHNAYNGSVHCVQHISVAGNRFWCDGYYGSTWLVWSAFETWLPTFCTFDRIDVDPWATRVFFKGVGTNRCAPNAVQPNATQAYYSGTVYEGNSQINDGVRNGHQVTVGVGGTGPWPSYTGTAFTVSIF